MTLEESNPVVVDGTGGLVPVELPTNPTYQQIRDFESALLQYEKADIPVDHYFADGIYGRAIRVKAGTFFSGKMHRMSTLNMLLAGECQITTDNGVEHIKAPAVYVSPPGTKKVCRAITDMWFLVVHPTKLRDISAIESKFMVPEEPLLEASL